MTTLFFHLLRPKILELSLPSLFLSYSLLNPSANYTGSIFKVHPVTTCPCSWQHYHSPRWRQQPPNWFSWPSAEQSWRNVPQSVISLLWRTPPKGSPLRRHKSWRLWWLQATAWPGPALALWSLLPSLIHLQYTGLLAALFCWLRNLEMAHSKHQVNKYQLNQSDRAWNTLLLTQTHTTKQLWVWI